MNISADLITKTQQAIIDYNGQTIPLEAISLQETRKEFDGEITIVTYQIYPKIAGRNRTDYWYLFTRKLRLCKKL